MNRICTLLTLAIASALTTLGSAQPIPAEPDARVTPGANEVIFIPSPNFNARPEGTVVDTIVLHHTASSTTTSCVRWFENPEARASSHYVVGKDGSIIQMVNTFYRAWHAGVSKDHQGRENVNNFSVGIEIVNKGDGVEPYPAAQVLAVRLLVGYLARHHFRGQIRTVISHEYIAQPLGRKNDPILYPWDSLYGVADELGFQLIWGRPDREFTVRQPSASAAGR